MAICSAAILATATCPGADTNSFAARAEHAFHDAEKLADSRPVAVTTLVHLARAAFDAAEFTRSDDRREEFALVAAPLTRWHLIRLDAHDYHFVWTYHHALFDGWSDVMFRIRHSLSAR